MPFIKPFRAVRPNKSVVGYVAALPYDVVSTEEARELTAENPLSFLHVDRAEVDLPSAVDPYDALVYAKARENLDAMMAEHVFIEDEDEHLYIYRQIMDGRVQTGLVCCTSIDDYEQGIIKKHEHTLPSKEADRIRHMEACEAHTGPIFQAYRPHPEVHSVLSDWTGSREALYDFATSDDVRHVIWLIDDAPVKEKLISLFQDIPHLYIADGHHRTAAAWQVGRRRRDANPNYTGNEGYNFFLSILFPADELHVMPYNRVVQNLGGLSEEDFLTAVKERFSVESAEEPVQPTQKYHYGMCLGGRWYLLKAKDIPAGDDPVAALDVSVLQNCLLQPILGIDDPRSDDRIAFVGGIRGTAGLETYTAEGAAAAFSLYPTGVEEVMAAADAGRVMPPKSTWFEPKLRSGVFIHRLDDGHSSKSRKSTAF